MQRDWVILVDEREKRPLTIPSHLVVWDRSSPPLSPRTCTLRLTVRKTRLPTGDYLLESHPNKVICERKGSLAELGGNLLTPEGRRKFVAEMERLKSQCSHPLLLLEGAPHTLSKNTRGHDPALVRDTLMGLLHEYNVEMLLLPTDSSSARTACGEWLAAKLITGALHHGNPAVQHPGPPPP